MLASALPMPRTEARCASDLGLPEARSPIELVIDLNLLDPRIETRRFTPISDNPFPPPEAIHDGKQPLARNPPSPEPVGRLNHADYPVHPHQPLSPYPSEHITPPPAPLAARVPEH
ncbi:hypothetical protein GCM10022245_18760 [Streptomyces mayteni]